jgi:hypothetical protein
VTFRREKPTFQKKDFVGEEGLEGPGRLLGCSIGVRVIDEGFWYGEGEVKIYRDGDRDLPTIYGTGLEDYAGSALGARPTFPPVQQIDGVNLSHQTQPDWKKQSGAKKEGLNGEEALFA